MIGLQMMLQGKHDGIWHKYSGGGGIKWHACCGRWKALCQSMHLNIIHLGFLTHLLFRP